MRKENLELADSILEPVFVFMRAQTDKSRMTIDELGNYLQYRERDVGSAYVHPCPPGPPIKYLKSF